MHSFWNCFTETGKMGFFVKVAESPATNFSSHFSSWIQFHSFSIWKKKKWGWGEWRRRWYLSDIPDERTWGGSWMWEQWTQTAVCSGFGLWHSALQARGVAGFAASCRWMPLCNCCCVTGQWPSWPARLPPDCISVLFQFAPLFYLFVFGGHFLPPFHLMSCFVNKSLCASFFFPLLVSLTAALLEPFMCVYVGHSAIG